MKQCSKCKQTKLLFNFSKNKNKKDGIQDMCKLCVANYVSSIAGKSSRLFSGCKRRAKSSGGKVLVTREWLENRLTKGVCELTGLPFDFSGRGEFSRKPYAPSVDRKDPQNPDYTPENTRVVLWAVNCAMAEYGEKIMFPIFKALIHAKEITTTSVSAGDYIAGAVGAELGSVSTPWTWEDDDHSQHHCGTIHWEDFNYRTKAGGGDRVGHGGQEVGAPKTLESFKDYWESREKTRRIVG